MYQRVGSRLFCAVSAYAWYREPAGGATTVGVDIVDVRRVARLIGRPRAAERLLTQGELDYCRARVRSAEHVAARFAAKEAVFKAFGTGLGSGVSWKDVEVVRGRAGEPQVRLHGVAAALAQRRRLVTLAVSLSHTSELAIAHAVAGWLSGPDEEGYCYD
jgi:holo-[acyl-carrier protein] synthase